MLWLLVLLALPLVAVGALAVSAVQGVRARRRKHRSTVVAFFHPYAYDCGGGEKVLWRLVRDVQEAYPDVHCVLYTGREVSAPSSVGNAAAVTSDDILRRVRDRFGIELPRFLEFVFLDKREWVEAIYYPRLTMVMQALGSLVLGWEALTLCVPDVLIDTMGFSFVNPLFKLVGGCQVACYVHYPTISTDMLEAVATRRETTTNSAAITSSAAKTAAKLWYYRAFALLYALSGACADVVMVNSRWTYGHLASLWRFNSKIAIVYPPCDTEGLSSLEAVPARNERNMTLVSIGQFRPEKNHQLQVRIMRKLLDLRPDLPKTTRLAMIGSTRNLQDKRRLQELKSLAKELKVAPWIDFLEGIPRSQMEQILAKSFCGLHTMWNEHFGIGVVEIMAAGVIPIAHNSGGPRDDIVVPLKGQTVGFLATTADEYAAQIDALLSMPPQQLASIQTAARQSADRFSDRAFSRAALECLTEISF